MVAKRWKMEEDMGEEHVVLPFLADEELISISGWKRIAAAFSCVAESTNAEKRDLRIKAKVEDVWADGYVNLSNLRELNVRTLRNELEWPMLLARQFVRMVTAMSFVEQRGVRVQEDGSGNFFSRYTCGYREWEGCVRSGWGRFFHNLWRLLRVLGIPPARVGLRAAQCSQ